MKLRYLVAALLWTVPAAEAQEALVTYRSLSPELALELARATLDACRGRGFQVAVAVVDRFGQPQAVLRDRFAGPHTGPTASGKAWTAVTFRTNTTDLIPLTQPGQPQAGLRALPNVVILGGGLVIEAQGSLVGGIGVSGAPGGAEDDACARAGLDSVRDKLEF
ncbi:MAG TPA: heme-binding protein [Beijerinckiaceae bacterium]|jgi:uncharacterized protein GlcG (DUF336 family)|nr:hypothetical protein [Microvirga sp.]HZB37673.1 heme-binding protein [Beijerinckiaceae bacterium]